MAAKKKKRARAKKAAPRAQSVSRLRSQYLDRFRSLREAVDFEARALSIAEEHLPTAARRVRDGGQPSAAYYNWLLTQVHGVEQVSSSVAALLAARPPAPADELDE